MQFNALKPSVCSFTTTTTASVPADARPFSSADNNSPDYLSKRQQRLAERLCHAGDRSATCWNHFITIVVWSSDSDNIAALPRTLGSLLAQSYRNFEVLVVSQLNLCPSDLGDFTSCRGLFAEPDIEVLDLLSDSATDPLWRGSHLIFVRAGTEFDPDAIELLNAALDNLSDPTAPALVLCEERSLAVDFSIRPSPDSPDRHADVVHSFDRCGPGFMISRTLLQLARRPKERPTSLQDWLDGLTTMMPAPQTVHIAETLIHVPPEAHLASRSTPGIAP